ncbi:helix-turn-helix transcriptional regulator [Phenylobacterium sp.]|jgi:transcriptional regulator with XRE-family HTH domain|uniref:helix-turn-helix domain-containing protein n=1 Tax=Phenylobacterium sp. TaxID=1871053 RepID=UPI001B58A34A|nr:helix-turn-helix transcriptional regulator [Phenylobacterium sp.]MBP9754046.1 helix-turn-helix transcriptional regulator [Phenylobacterium sp.]MDO8324712.1 helix-turn-helix transcriptional regulator [Phenylobacterium sp.]
MTEIPEDEPKTPDVFGERLRAARDLRGMNQGDLARKTGLPASSIAHFEAGGRKPSFENLRRLATQLNVTTDYLLGRVAEPGQAAAADPLYRHVSQISDADRDIAEEFLEMLANRNKRRTEGGEP